ncbi:MAG: hypothetical protein EBU57_12085 [Alphaproteobacteria bacterium]|nr:hypothetical protein [Alphaproteobacteria bacterium]
MKLKILTATLMACQLAHLPQITLAQDVQSEVLAYVERARALAGEDHARFVQLMTEYDPQPPFNSGSMATAPDAVREKAQSLFGE